MACDMCGKSGDMFETVVEGTKLTVCQSCSKYGKVQKRISPQPTIKQMRKQEKQQREEQEEEQIIEVIKEDCPKIMRKQREKHKLTQKEFAKKLSEKESIIQKIETGNFEPSIEMARKFEKILHITLIEQVKDTTPILSKETKNSGPLTLGDFIKVRKRK